MRKLFWTLVFLQNKTDEIPRLAPPFQNQTLRESSEEPLPKRIYLQLATSYFG